MFCWRTWCLVQPMIGIFRLHCGKKLEERTQPLVAAMVTSISYDLALCSLIIPIILSILMLLVILIISIPLLLNILITTSVSIQVTCWR